MIETGSDHLAQLLNNPGQRSIPTPRPCALRAVGPAATSEVGLRVLSTRAPPGAGAGEEGGAIQSHPPKTHQCPLRPGVSTAGAESYWRHSCWGWSGVG